MPRTNIGTDLWKVAGTWKELTGVVGRPRKRLRCGNEKNARVGAPGVTNDQKRQVGRSASRQVAKLAGRQVGRSPSWQVAKLAGRQVGKSAEDITLPVQGPARGLGGDYPGGDACFGPRPATSTPHGLTTENSAQIPLVGKTSHWGGVVLEVCSHLGLSDHFSQIIYFCIFFYFYSI